jgi:hypothetical protein
LKTDAAAGEDADEAARLTKLHRVNKIWNSGSQNLRDKLHVREADGRPLSRDRMKLRKDSSMEAETNSISHRQQKDALAKADASKRQQNFEAKVTAERQLRYAEAKTAAARKQREIVEEIAKAGLDREAEAEALRRKLNQMTVKAAADERQQQLLRKREKGFVLIFSEKELQEKQEREAEQKAARRQKQREAEQRAAADRQRRQKAREDGFTL